MGIVNEYGNYRKSPYQITGNDKKTKETERTGRSGNTDRTKKTEKNTGIADGVKLSENAKKLLDELKEKYGNMDFFIADYDSEEEAQSYLSRGTKEFSVLIDPATLEEMAAKKESKEKYLGILDEAVGNLSDMKKELSEEEGNTVNRIGISIDNNGKVSYFAELEKMGEKQRERIKKQEAEAIEKKAETKRQERQAEKERVWNAAREREPHIPKTTKKVSVQADSADELLKKIRSVDWSQIKSVERVNTGGKLDLSV